MTYYDFEYLIIYAVLALLFIAGLRPRKTIGGGDQSLFVIDLPMSKAMKGMACVMILTSHWGLKRFGGVSELGGISKIVWSMSAQIALVWFMFFSGYGMSLKKITSQQILGKWKNSCLKIYIPCLLVCIATFILFFFLHDNFPPTARKALGIDPDIHILHNLTWQGAVELLPNLFGHEFWYVECILMFYSIYYASCWLSSKIEIDITWILSAMFFVYFLIARQVYGLEQAHFFRFCWTFMFGHAVARRTKLSWAMAILFLLTTLVEKELMNVYLWAVVGILLISIINSRFEMRGRIILYLGSISYIYYLAHIRIAYHLLVYMHIDSIIAWTILSAGVSAVLYEINKRITCRIKK